MKTLLALSTLALAVIWIRRRRDRAQFAELAEGVGAWYAREIPG